MQFVAILFSKSSLIRSTAGLALAAGSLVFTGCSSLSVRQDVDSVAALAPAPVLVAKGAELHTAEVAAAHTTGAQAFLGAGESMEPIYATGTAIVVTPCDFSTLRPGMSVVYVDRNGRGVAHALVNKSDAGWVAQGVNNRERDEDLVTARDLVGLITQAYASSDTTVRREAAARAMFKMASTMDVKSQVAQTLSRAGTTGMVLASQ